MIKNTNIISMIKNFAFRWAGVILGSCLQCDGIGSDTTIIFERVMTPRFLSTEGW